MPVWESEIEPTNPASAIWSARKEFLDGFRRFLDLAITLTVSPVWPTHFEGPQPENIGNRCCKLRPRSDFAASSFHYDIQNKLYFIMCWLTFFLSLLSDRAEARVSTGVRSTGRQAVTWFHRVYHGAPSTQAATWQRVSNKSIVWWMGWANSFSWVLGSVQTPSIGLRHLLESNARSVGSVVKWVDWLIGGLGQWLLIGRTAWLVG